MTGVRRSGRVPKEIPIVLLGTDTSGRVFSEETRTLVLSRHGAGILSHYKFSPDERLTMRLAGTSQESEIRLVGYLGEDPSGGNVYGVAFCDPELNFWQMDFPPPPQQHLLPPGVALECCFCNSRSLVQQTEIEADVYLASKSLFRFCESCAQTTPWKPATGEVSEAPLVNRPQVTPQLTVQPSASVSPVSQPASAYSASFLHAEFDSAAAVPVSSSYPSSAYAATAVLDEIVTSGFMPPTQSASLLQTSVTPASPKTVPVTAPQTFAGGGKKNRRRHVRTRVCFTACIRLDSHDDLVECDNVSKGGLCFRSRKLYKENMAIEVAVPYSPGQPAIFVKAQIRRVEALTDNLFRYGVAYS